jgi:DNA-binding transcriptional LysR family regulator
MNLSLKQIEMFRAIMAAGSITEAARLLHVSEPAVSRMLAYAERRTGLSLFQRIKGRLVATPEARRLYQEVNVVYQGVQRVNAVIDELLENRSGCLRIASSLHLGVSLLSEAIAEFHRRFPGVGVTLHTLSPDAVVQAVLTNQVDLGVAIMLNRSHPSLSYESLCMSRFVACMRPTHKFANRPALTIADLVDEPMIGYGDIPFGHLVNKLFQAAGFQHEPCIKVHQVQVACVLSALGVGMAIVDEFAARSFKSNNLVSVPMTPEVTMPVTYFHIAAEPLARTAQAFIEILRKMAQAENSHQLPISSSCGS